MSDRKERHTCESCIHDNVCEWSVYDDAIFCDDYIDKNDYKRPVGEWLCIPNGYMGINFGRKCSLCGKTVEFFSNFCPNCGAYMRR